MGIKLETYHIQTVSGELSSFGDKLPFLTELELNEFNKIGYTGKNSQGEKTSQVEYLESLGKGTFSMRQTKFNNGDFVEKFMVSRAYNTEDSCIAETLFQSETEEEFRREFEGESYEEIRAEREDK